MAETINFWATVARVQTLADGGLRVTLDLPEDAILQAAQLMECKRRGAVLNFEASPRGDDGTDRAIGRAKAKKRKSDGGSGV